MAESANLVAEWHIFEENSAVSLDYYYVNYEIHHSIVIVAFKVYLGFI